MFDQIDAPQSATWHSNLKPGDIVAFRFPHETDGAEAPKVRPTLVLDVEERASTLIAVHAYGTSNPRRIRGAYIIDVWVEAELQTASLRKPTRFHASRRIDVALNNPWFDVNLAKKCPVLGTLTGDAFERLQDVHADREIRRSGLYGRRRSGRSHRPVTVKDQYQSGPVALSCRPWCSFKPLSF